MKKILISIKPKYVAEILNHRKTLEIRKSAPKCELPCEVYIYCTKLVPYGRGCMYDEVAKRYMTTFCNDGKELPNLTGRVVAKFALDKVDELHPFFHWCEEIKRHTCLERDEVLDYLDGKDKSVGNPKRQRSVYAWHIDKLVPFDRPKELKDFGVKRSPQSYQFIEVDE